MHMSFQNSKYASIYLNYWDPTSQNSEYAPNFRDLSSQNSENAPIYLNHALVRGKPLDSSVIPTIQTSCPKILI